MLGKDPFLPSFCSLSFLIFLWYLAHYRFICNSFISIFGITVEALTPQTLYFPHAKISTVSMTLCAIDLESGKYYSIFERILLCFVRYMRNKNRLK